MGPALCLCWHFIVSSVRINLMHQLQVVRMLTSSSLLLFICALHTKKLLKGLSFGPSGDGFKLRLDP